MRLFFVCLALGVALLIGCSSGDDRSSPTGPTAPPDPLIADPGAAVKASAERTAGLQSARSDFAWHIERDGFDIQGDGEYTFMGPDDLHLNAHYKGHGQIPSQFAEQNDSEILALGQQVYLHTPALGNDWILFTPDELRTDWDVLQRLEARRSPLDYQAVVNSVTGGISSEPQTLVRYKTTIDTGVLMNGLADAYGSQGQVMLANRFAGPIPVFIQLDPATLLPVRLTAEGDFPFMGAAAKLTLEVNYRDYNDVREFPPAPPNAKPLRQP